MIPRGYYATLEKTEDTVLVRFPQHSNIITYGFDWEHAEEMAKEVLSAVLETDYETGYKLPPLIKPRVKKGQKLIFVEIDPEVHTAYLLRFWREESSLTQKQLAKRMGVSYQAYQRMERPGRSNLTVSTLQRLAHALKKELVIELR